MYLLDTNVIIWVLRNEIKYVNWLDKIINKSKLGISTITIAEIYKNIYPSELINTELLLEKFKIFTVTGKIAKQAGLYWQQFSKIKIHLLDCLIAATAKQNNLKLVTLNIKHFPMDDIEVLKPL